MAVAIPAAIALSWFESVADRVQSDMEDMATRLFTRCATATTVAA
jgi:biopolymer transport protein ExbB